MAEPPLRQRPARLVEDLHLVLGKGASHGHEAQRRLVVPRGTGGARGLEGRARHRVHARGPAHGREAQRDRALGQAVHGHHGLAAEAEGGEARHEALDGVGAHRLRAVEGHAPRREVEPFQGAVGDLAHAQLVGEVRRGRERGPMLVDAPEPALGPGQEGERALKGERDPVMEAEEPRPDEAHVVVQGEPARAHVGGTEVEAARDGADVGEQVVVGEEHALGGARAARGVLDEGGIAASPFRRRARPAARDELVDRHHLAQRGHGRAQDGGHAPRPRHRDQGAHPGVGEDGGLPARVLLQPVEARGRVDRHRHRPREEDPLEGGQELASGRQHQGHGVAADEPALAQPARDRGGLGEELAVRDRLLHAALAAQVHVGADGQGLRATPEGFVDGGGGGGSAGGLQRRRAAGGKGLARGASLQDQPGHIAGRVRLQEAVVERAAEGRLQAQQELDALQASQADFTLEGGVGGDRARRAGPAQLLRQAAHHLEHALLHLGGRGGGGGNGGGRLAHGMATVIRGPDGGLPRPRARRIDSGTEVGWRP